MDRSFRRDTKGVEDDLKKAETKAEQAIAAPTMVETIAAEALRLARDAAAGSWLSCLDTRVLRRNKSRVQDVRVNSLRVGS
eukprot:3524793-Pyramimonas_sp.AAC.1